jgi:hypothetical protein
MGVGESLDFLIPGNSTFGTRDDWDTSSDGKLTGRDLVAKGINNIWLGADELYSRKEEKHQLASRIHGRSRNPTRKHSMSLNVQ